MYSDRYSCYRLSPSFFERCEREYPNAIGFVRRYIPLGWPKPVEEKPEEPFSVSMSSKELEEEVTRILQQVDPVAMEEEEEVADAIAPEEVNPLEMEHIMSVLAAARLMMEKEVELGEKEEVECEKEEVVEPVEVVESVEKENESVEEVAETVEAKEEEFEETPVEEAPVEEPIEETPIKETPVEQKQPEEKPIETQPSQPQSTQVKQPQPTEVKHPQPTEAKQPSPSEVLITQLTEKIVTLESSLRQHSLEENDRVKAILKKQGDMLEDDVRSVISLSPRSRNASPSCRNASSPNSKRRSAPRFWKKRTASWSGTRTAWRVSASCTPPRSPSTTRRRSRTRRTSWRRRSARRRTSGGRRSKTA